MILLPYCVPELSRMKVDLLSSIPKNNVPKFILYQELGEVALNVICRRIIHFQALMTASTLLTRLKQFTILFDNDRRRS
jgi:hypothetical protein